MLSTILTLASMSVSTVGIALAAAPSQKPRLGKVSFDQVIDVNNIAMFVTNQGSFAWNLTTGYSGLEFPKGTYGQTAVFAAGPWIAGKVNGEIRVAIAEYSFEFAPGPILPDGTPADPQLDRYRVYKINKGDGPENPDYAQWPVEDGAPVNPDGTPMVLGDQTLWAVYNDADPGVHVNMQTAPLGIEIQQTTFGFDRTDPLGNVVFIKFLIINKGGNTIDSTYVSLWSDPDLGQLDNDLVGCDVETSFGFCYNGSNTDSQYGSSPPAVGYDFFKGPIGDDGVELPMTSFNKYINGTDPYTAEQVYNYMKGLDPDGGVALHTDPITGQVKAFMVDGDPVAGTGWLDENPADRRLMLTAGPFTFAPGDTQEVVVGIIMGQGQDRLTSITAVRVNDTFAQSAFDADFVVFPPPPPPSPPTPPPPPPPPPVGIKDWDIPSGGRWYTWANTDWGAEGFGGAMTGDIAHQWFGPTSVPPSRLVNVELRFTSVIEDEGEDQYKPIDLTNPNVSWGYRYLRSAGAPAPAPADQTTTKSPYDWSNYIINTSGPGEYVYQERNPIALSAWDVENNRRLEVGWLENNQPGGLVNGAYGPAYYNDVSNLATSGPREWLFIFDRDYTEPDDDSNLAELSQGLINDNPAPPIMYIIFAARRIADRFPQDGDSFLILVNRVNDTNPGDFNGDGTINFSDFLLFIVAFGTGSGDAGFDAQMDLNGDGMIDFSDFLIFVGHYGSGTSGSKAALPLPFPYR